MRMPFISIIIPVYNSETGLTKTVESLLRLEYPKEKTEIIIVDNKSSDRSFDTAREYSREHPELITALQESGIQSSYAARNKGVKNSKGEILAFLDADMTVDPDWLIEISAFMNKNSAYYIGSNVQLYSNEKENFFEKFDRLTGFPVKEYLGSRHFAPTCCLSVKRSVFDKVGLFNEELESSGDYEFGNRIYDNSIDQFFAKTITVHHPTRKTLKALIKKSWRVGKGRAHVKKLGIKLHYKKQKKWLERKDLSNKTSDLSVFETAAFALSKLTLLTVKSCGFLHGSILKNT